MVRILESYGTTNARQLTVALAEDNRAVLDAIRYVLAEEAVNTTARSNEAGAQGATRADAARGVRRLL